MSEGLTVRVRVGSATEDWPAGYAACGGVWPATQWALCPLPREGWDVLAVIATDTEWIAFPSARGERS